MKQILFSVSKNIEYDETSVKVNGKKIAEEELLGNEPKEYALNSMREYYKLVLSNHIENLIILSGAGTSVGIGKSNKGKTMAGLWECVINELGEEALKDFCGKIKYDKYDKKYSDLEAILSKANISNIYLEDKSIKETVEKIENIIKKNCKIDLPDGSPHEQLLKKATCRKLKYPRLKIFTLNYDLLFEQAASKNGYVVIDGFSFGFPRRFSGVNFDYDIVLRNNSRITIEENYATRVFHLYKPHGSLDWEKIGGDDEHIIKSSNVKNPLMIYPNRDKYESSYEQPYFEMMSRFQQELRKHNTFLIVIGFSFYDKHISAMIYEALNVNPSIDLMVVSPDVNNVNKFVELKQRVKHSGNIFLVNESFEDFSKYYPYSEIYDFSKLEVEKDEQTF